MSEPMRFTVPAKFILVGEHAVVYGGMGMAFPVATALEVECWPAPTVEIEGLDERFLSSGLFAEVLETLHRLVEFGGFRAIIESRLPAGAGLGLSAALSCALVRCALASCGLAWNPAHHRGLVHELEKVFHGTPSGIDDATISFASPVMLNHRDGISFLKERIDSSLAVLDVPSPPVVLVDSGQKSDTAEMVRMVRERLGDGEERRLFVSRSDTLVVRALRFLGAKDWQGLGSVMDEAHDLLLSVGLSTPAIEEIRSLARRFGAYGSKVTGAGGGGMVAVLVQPSRLAEAAEFFASQGYGTVIW